MCTQNLSILPSADGHLSCFRLLAVASSPAVGMLVRVFECLFSVPLGICPGVELLDHMMIVCLTFEELPDCFPSWLRHFTSPLAVHKGSGFFAS